MSINLLGATRGVRTYGNIAKSRLEQEFQQLQQTDIPYLASVNVLKSNFSQWQIILEGPPATPYQDRYFEARIDFPKRYPFVPFKLTWKTKIYHLILQKDEKVLFDFEIQDDNNDQDGEYWSPAMTVYSILEEFYCMIFSSITIEDIMDYYDPLPHTGINRDAIHLCAESPNAFLNNAREYTQKYAISAQNLQDFVHYPNENLRLNSLRCTNNGYNYYYHKSRSTRFGLRDRNIRFSIVNNCYVLLVHNATDSKKEKEKEKVKVEEKDSGYNGGSNMQQLKSVLEKDFGFYVNYIKIENPDQDQHSLNYNNNNINNNSNNNIIGERNCLLDDYDIGSRFLQQLQAASMQFHKNHGNYDGFMLIYKGFGSYSNGIIFNSDKEGVQNNNVSFYQIKSIFSRQLKSTRKNKNKNKNKNIPMIFIFDTSNDKENNNLNINNAIFNANCNHDMSLNRRRVRNSHQQIRCMEIYHTSDGNKSCSSLVEGLLDGLRTYHVDNALNVVGQDGFQLFSIWLKNILRKQDNDVKIDIHDTVGFDVYLGTQNFHTSTTNRWMDGCILGCFIVAVFVIFGLFVGMFFHFASNM